MKSLRRSLVALALAGALFVPAAGSQTPAALLLLGLGDQSGVSGADDLLAPWLPGSGLGFGLGSKPYDLDRLGRVGDLMPYLNSKRGTPKPTVVGSVSKL